MTDTAEAPVVEQPAATEAPQENTQGSGIDRVAIAARIAALEGIRDAKIVTAEESANAACKIISDKYAAIAKEEKKSARAGVTLVKKAARKECNAASSKWKKVLAAFDIE